MSTAWPVKRRWVYRSPGRMAGLLGLVLAAAVGMALSRPLPPAVLSPVQPALDEANAAAVLAGAPGADSLLSPGQGPAAGEYLLVTAANGPAAALLPELARLFSAHGPSRSLFLAAGEDPALPGPVVAHLHLEYRMDERTGIEVVAAGGYPPVWLRELARAAVAIEAGLAPETMAAQFRNLAVAAGRPAPRSPAIALAGTGPGPADLAVFGRAVERVLYSLDELPAVPRPELAGMGRSSILYLVLGRRYVPAPGLWLAQLLALLPLGVTAGRGLRRVRRPWRWLDDDATILAAVQFHRFEQGKPPPTPGRTRAQRRRQRLQGAWRLLAGEAAWWLVWLGGGGAAVAAYRVQLLPALAGMALAAAGWVGRKAGAGPAEDRCWAMLVLLLLVALAAVLATDGNPVVLVALYPAALLWPFLTRGRTAGSCPLALAGLTGAAWLLAVLPWPPPGPAAPVLLAVVTLAACALRLALERLPVAGGDLE